MARKSRKKLKEVLGKHGIKLVTSPGGEEGNYPGMGFEAYGRDVHAYIQWHPPHTRLQVERILEQEGFKVHSGWCADRDDRTSIEVSYFKAWHWDE